MFTATGFIVMCVAAVSTCTANDVESPPRPCGPTPSWFTASRAPLRASRLPGLRSGCRAGASRRPSTGARTGPPCRRRRRRRSSAGTSCRRRRARSRSTNVLTASMPSAGTAILSHELFSEPEPFGIISIDSVLGARHEIDVDHRHQPPAGRVLVLARDRMHDRRAQRMLVRRALAAFDDRLLQLVAVDLDAAADRRRCRSGCRCPGTAGSGSPRRR